ncbi:hypothetical protein TNCV_1081611 [Trichonephila clavipes]|nr:hypothetical protein TNCV_1081611 [Trichonephila clavipes]
MHRRAKRSQLLTRMPDEEVINNGKDQEKERNVYKEILVTGGLGRKRQLQVIKPVVYCSYYILLNKGSEEFLLQ